MVGLPLLVYAASLVVLVRRASVSRAKGIACGLAGLVPLYFPGGKGRLNARRLEC
jgi:hypothetical protein